MKKVPKKASRKKESDSILSVDMLDGLLNFAANLGTRYDKNSQNFYADSGAGFWGFCATIYRESWVAAKIIDIPSYEMTREWRYFTMQHPEDIEKMIDAEEKYQLKDVVRDVLKWSRLFGGAAILIGVEGAGNLDEPLVIDKIKPGSLKFLRVIDRRYLNVVSSVDVYNPGSSNYMNPEFYNITSYSSKTPDKKNESGYMVHRSRLVKFDGVGLSLNELATNGYWGDSVLKRVMSTIKNSDMVQASISSMVHESNIDIWKIKNLQSAFLRNDGVKMLTDRVIANSQLKSINNAIMLDKDGEEFERKPISFSSLPEIMDRFYHLCAAGADIPATRLLGSSPDGMNATGDSDIRNFYDSMRSGQEDFIRPKLRKIDKIMAMSELGYIPDDLKFEFNPLWQISEKERAEIDNLKADRDTKYLREGVITASVVLSQLMIDETYQGIDDDMIEASRDLESNDLEEGSMQSLGYNPELTSAETESTEIEEDQPV